MRYTPLLIGLLTIACSSGETTIDTQQAAAHGSNTTSPTTSEQDLDTLLEGMDEFGPEAEQRHDQQKRAFLSKKGAVSTLITRYATTAAENHGARWKLVYLATQAQTPDAVPFLESVALAEVSSPRDSGGGQHDSGQHDSGGNGHDARLRAAVGLAHSMIAKVAGAEASVENVLRNADTDVARMAALELFSSGQLSSKHSSLLEARGVYTKFRRLTDAELRELRTVSAAELAPRETQANSRKKQHGEPPPARD